MIEVGRTYTAYRQGTAITPVEISVRVVAIDGDDVYYQKGKRPFIDQTTLARFEEIIDPNFRSDGRNKPLAFDDAEQGMTP